LPGHGLRLPVERQVVGVAGHQDVRHRGLGGQTTFDQTKWCKSLHHHAITSTAGELGAAGDDHPELRRDDVQALGGVLANP
jgi:hypothetical protein